MLKKLLIYTTVFFMLLGCSGKILQHEKAEQLQQNEEFEQKVKIVEVPAAGATKTDGEAATAPDVKAVQKKATEKKKKRGKQNKSKANEVTEPLSTKHEPDLEDSEGFVGRRPVVDPFRVGEEIVHKVYYNTFLMDLSAGTLSMKVEPFVEVNGRKSYQFGIEVQSSSWFSSTYSVEDKITTLMDYELQIPRVFTMHVKETKQLREVRSFFDFEQMKAIYWEKKVTPKSGIEEKKLQWEILPFSQNVFSAIFYLRNFKWDLNKEYSFRVADDEENLVFRGKAIAKETLKTELGPMAAIKIKPEFMVKGAFKPVGDIYIWVSDDERKYVLRIAAKIKIGTLVSEITSLRPGRSPK